MKNMDEYQEVLAVVRGLTGLDMLIPDETGLVTFRVEDQYNVSLQYVESGNKMLCFVEVAQLPKDARKGVYRDLLAGGLFGQGTAGGYFTLEPESETVIYNYFFDGGAAASDPEAFVDTLEKILQICDIWADRIRSGTDDTSSAQPEPYSHDTIFA